MEQKSLFDRLGGSSVLQQATQKLGDKLKSDPTLAPIFKNVDFQKMNENRASYFAKLFGGPNDYKGKSMKEAHQSYDIKDGHFELFIKYFKESLQELNVDKNIIEEAAQALKSTKNEVLNSKTLYDRLGAENFFGKFGELLGQKILKDSVLGPKYSQTDFQKVQGLRMQFLKTLFGGPGKYEGKDMKTAHSGQQLNDQHFDRFVGVFEETLAELKVNENLMKEAMSAIETLRPEVLNKTSLFEELGGYKSLEAVLRKFQERLKKDSTFDQYFKDVDENRLLHNRVAYFAKILGGPNAYSGRNMRDAHSSLKLNDQVFNMFLKHLRKTMLEEGVKEELVNKVLEASDLSRSDVLGRKSVMERLGGRDGLNSIVKTFHENLMKDNLLGPIYGKAADSQGLVRGYSHYLAYLFGGEEPHTRETLKSVHGKFELKDVHYDLFLDIFQETLKKFNVDQETREEAGQILEKQRNQILKRESLWRRLGGEEKMHKVCHTFEGILIKDPVVGPMHQSIDINKYHENHMDLFADLFGGYHFYSGKNLQEAHRTLKLNDDHFNLFVKLFQQALTENGVSEELVKEVKEKFEFERNEVLNRQSLYEKIGGEKTVDLLVEKLHNLIANDSVIGPMHKDVDWTKLQLHRKQYFTQMFGNLNVYQGKDLRSAHSGLNLKEEHFAMFLKLFKEAMGQVGMKAEHQEQAVGMLESTRSEVMNGPSVYEKMGGKDVLLKFVERLDEVVAKDDKLAKFFEKIDKKKLDEHQFQYFSNMLGGPKTSYEGKSMRQAHEQLPLSDEHFKVYMERTRETLKEIGVDGNVVEETLKLFQTKRSEVLNQ